MAQCDVRDDKEQERGMRFDSCKGFHGIDDLNHEPQVCVVRAEADLTCLDSVCVALVAICQH